MDISASHAVRTLRALPIFEATADIKLVVASFAAMDGQMCSRCYAGILEPFQGGGFLVCSNCGEQANVSSNWAGACLSHRLHKFSCVHSAFPDNLFMQLEHLLPYIPDVS